MDLLVLARRPLAPNAVRPMGPAIAFRNVLRVLCSGVARALLFVGLSLLVSCASAPKPTVTPRPVVTVAANTEERDAFLSYLTTSALRAKAIRVKGDIALDQGSSSNSASFSLKNKRLAEHSTMTGDHAVVERIDSLSMEVMGPLGIKVARFLASPVRYQFYDILQGETLSGATDARSLEGLTHLSGVSLGMMSDLVYGLVPDGSRIGPQDSVQVLSAGARHTMVLYRAGRNTTEVIDLDGDLSAGLPTRMRYRRWQGIIQDAARTRVRSAVYIDFTKYQMIAGVAVPQHIEAAAGENKLTLDYQEIDVNPSELTVKIKMP